MEIRKAKASQTTVYQLCPITSPSLRFFHILRKGLTPQREESIAKRRNFQPSADETIDSDDDADLASSSVAETLPAMLQAVYSDNPEQQLEATTQFRKWVIAQHVYSARDADISDSCQKRRTPQSTR